MIQSYKKLWKVTWIPDSAIDNKDEQNKVNKAETMQTLLINNAVEKVKKTIYERARPQGQRISWIKFATLTNCHKWNIWVFLINEIQSSHWKSRGWGSGTRGWMSVELYTLDDQNCFWYDKDEYMRRNANYMEKNELKLKLLR